MSTATNIKLLPEIISVEVAALWKLYFLKNRKGLKWPENDIQHYNLKIKYNPYMFHLHPELQIPFPFVLRLTISKIFGIFYVLIAHNAKISKVLLIVKWQKITLGWLSYEKPTQSLAVKNKCRRSSILKIVFSQKKSQVTQGQIWWCHWTPTYPVWYSIVT